MTLSGITPVSSGLHMMMIFVLVLFGVILHDHSALSFSGIFFRHNDSTYDMIYAVIDNEGQVSFLFYYFYHIY